MTLTLQAIMAALTQIRDDQVQQTQAIQLVQANDNSQPKGGGGDPLTQQQQQQELPRLPTSTLDISSLLKLPDRATSLQHRKWAKSWQLFTVRMKVATHKMEEQSAALVGLFLPGFDHIYD